MHACALTYMCKTQTDSVLTNVCVRAHTQIICILAGYPFNLERKQNFYLFPMLKLDEKTGFRAKKRFLVAILKFSDETGRRFLELLDVTIQYHRT